MDVWLVMIRMMAVMKVIRWGNKGQEMNYYLENQPLESRNLYSLQIQFQG